MHQISSFKKSLEKTYPHTFKIHQVWSPPPQKSTLAILISNTSHPMKLRRFSKGYHPPALILAWWHRSPRCWQERCSNLGGNPPRPVGAYETSQKQKKLLVWLVRTTPHLIANLCLSFRQHDYLLLILFITISTIQLANLGFLYCWWIFFWCISSTSNNCSACFTWPSSICETIGLWPLSPRKLRYQTKVHESKKGCPMNNYKVLLFCWGKNVNWYQKLIKIDNKKRDLTIDNITTRSFSGDVFCWDHRRVPNWNWASSGSRPDSPRNSLAAACCLSTHRDVCFSLWGMCLFLCWFFRGLEA